jgi:PilZ domain-containing protein
MANDNGEGVSYLQALRQSTMTASATAAQEPTPLPLPEAGNTSLASAEQPGYKGTEQRKSPRYRCEGSAELIQDGLDLRTWATFTDISMHGCYVELTATFPIGTMLHTKLEVNGIMVRARGIVRVSYPSLGMGIAFTEMSAAYRDQLRDLLKDISRPSVIMAKSGASAPTSVAPLGVVPIITDAMTALRAIIRFFEERQVLTQPDFLRLLHRSQEQKHAK